MRDQLSLAVAIAGSRGEPAPYSPSFALANVGLVQRTPPEHCVAQLVIRADQHSGQPGSFSAP
jgi:hypothetical protein